LSLAAAQLAIIVINIEPVKSCGIAISLGDTMKNKLKILKKEGVEI